MIPKKPKPASIYSNLLKWIPTCLLLIVFTFNAKATAPDGKNPEDYLARMEWRGVINLDDQMHFSIHDRHQGIAIWLTPGRIINELEVTGFDQKKQEITLRHGDKVRKLSMNESRILNGHPLEKSPLIASVDDAIRDAITIFRTEHRSVDGDYDEIIIEILKQEDGPTDFTVGDKFTDHPRYKLPSGVASNYWGDGTVVFSGPSKSIQAYYAYRTLPGMPRETIIPLGITLTELRTKLRNAETGSSR